jgi:hypothetical protein
VGSGQGPARIGAVCFLVLAADLGCLNAADSRRPDAGKASLEDAGALPDASCSDCLRGCAAGCVKSCDLTGDVVAEVQGCAPTGFSVALDGDSPVVSLCRCDQAFVVSGVGGAWQAEAVAQGCLQTSLRVGAAGRALLVTDNAGSLRLFLPAPAGWTDDTPRQLEPPAALALDPTGVPHLAGLAQGAVVHAMPVKGGWTTEGVAAGPLQTGSRVVMALGPDSQPRIAFSDGAVKVATRTESGWTVSTVAERGRPVSLQVGADGRSHLFYLSDGLRYAASSGAAWASEAVDPAATAGTLRLGPGGCPRGMWMGASSMPTYGERSETGWQSRQLSSDTLHGPSDEPLAIDSTGRVFLGGVFGDALYLDRGIPQ